jgi:disintegrin
MPATLASKLLPAARVRHPFPRRGWLAAAGVLAIALSGGARADGGPATPGVECDEVHTCVVDDPTHICEVPVTLAADGVLRVTVQEDDPVAFTARWRIFTADGNAAPACGDYRTATATDCGPLPAGDYRIQVSSASATTGGAAIHLQRESGCASTLLECDQHATDEITSPVDTDLFRFTTAGDEYVRVTVREESGTLQAEWRVLTAAGLPAATCGDFQRALSADCGPLAPGSYQLEVRDEPVAGTGTYTVHLQRLTAAYACDGERIGCDQLATGEIVVPVDSDLFRVTLTTVDTLRVWVSPRSGMVAPEWRLLTAAGVPAMACPEFTTTRTADCGPLVAGEYQVQVKDDAARHAGLYDVAFTFLFQRCPTCGNGVVAGAEQCDPPGECCTALCRFAPSETVCRPTAGPCDRTEHCSGTSGTCPENLLREAGTPCGDVGACGVVRTCTGDEVSCPAVVFPADATCRECTVATECADDDACSSDDCVGGRCVTTPPAGFDGIDCELVKLLGGRPCGLDPIDGRFARQISRRGAKARRLLATARGTTRAARQARLLARVDRLLAGLATTARRRADQGLLGTTCAQTITQVLDGSRTLVAGLVP